MKKLLLATVFSTLLAANSQVVQAEIILAVSEQAAPAIREQAAQLAGRFGSETGTSVVVRPLADNATVELWLNRLATADLALLEESYVTEHPGRFIVIGTTGKGGVLVGRQGIGGDLPQKAARLVKVGDRLPPASHGLTGVQTAVPIATRHPPATAGNRPAISKSLNEDRYFVTYVYQDKVGRDPEPERLEYWTNQLRSGALSKQQLLDRACRPERPGCNFR